MKVYFIIGMHRSGTSWLAKYYNEVGVAFKLHNIGDIYDKHFEYWEVNNINDYIIKDWKNPKKIARFKQTLIYFKIKKLQKNLSNLEKSFGLKDPRFCFTLSYWLKYFKNFQIIGIFRRPFEVAKSLDARKNNYEHVDIEDGLKLWKTYNEAMIKIHEKYNCPIINFNLSKIEIETYLKNISLEIGIPYKQSAFENTYNDAVIRQIDNIIPNNCKSTYQKLLNISDRYKIG